MVLGLCNGIRGDDVVVLGLCNGIRRDNVMVLEGMM